jgi:hypothetical protein
MISTSDAYKAAIKADTELAVMEAEFGFVPPGAVEGAAVASSAQSAISRLSQINNGSRSMDAKWASLEPFRFLLDGSYVLIDTTDAAQVGFWSNNFCDASGNFATKPYIDYTMDAAYDMIGISVAWDEPGGEWATSATVSYYNASNALLKQQTFENDKAISLFDMTQTGVKWFRLEVNAWNIPDRMAKVAAVLPGQIYYLQNDIFGFEYSEAIALFDPSIVLPEFVIKFDNSAREFDIVNPQGLMSFLRQKMQIKTNLRIETVDGWERVSTGSFYLYAWPENTQDEVASFTCTPSIAILAGYYTDNAKSTQTAAQAAATIFANVEEAYTIETELQSIVVNRYIGDKVPILSAMGQLAVACAGYWTIDRDGSYHLKKWQAPAITNDIDYDNAWEKPDISQRKRVTSVNVPYTAYDLDGNLESIDNIVSLSVNDGGMEEINSLFIPSAARATAVANSALAYYALRLEFESSYRGDPSMQAGDGASVEHDYGESNVIVTEHTFTVDENGLNATIKGVGL